MEFFYKSTFDINYELSKEVTLIVSQNVATCFNQEYFTHRTHENETCHLKTHKNPTQQLATSASSDNYFNSFKSFIQLSYIEIYATDIIQFISSILKSMEENIFDEIWFQYMTFYIIEVGNKIRQKISNKEGYFIYFAKTLLVLVRIVFSGALLT